MGVLLLFFWRIVLYPGEMIYSPSSDIVEQYYPWRSLADNALKDGRLPMWNVHNFAGEPLLANMQLAFFYPPNLVMFSVLPADMAFGYSFILHLFFAGASTYFIAKRVGLQGIYAILPGMLFIFSGYFTGHVYAGHYGQVCSASWIPLVFLVFDKALQKESWKWGIVLGIVVGVQFLAGHIQITLFSGFICLVYFIYHVIMERNWLKEWKKAVRSFSIPVIAALTAFLIGILQFIPSFIYTDSTTRSGGMSYGWVTSYSLPPQNILTLLLPNLFGTPLDGSYYHLWNYWELSFYMGIFTLLLVGLSWKFRKDRYVRFFMILGLLSFIMALGRYTPVYWIFYKIVPGFDILRVPSRFVVLLILSSSILAGFGLRRITEENDRDTRIFLRRTFGSTLVASAIILIVAISLAIWQESIIESIRSTIDVYLDDPDLLATGHSIVDSALVGVIRDLLTLLIILSALAAMIVWKLKGRERRKHYGHVAVMFILLNLAWYHSGFIDTRDPDEIYDRAPYIDFLTEHSESYRVYDASDLIEDNYQIIHGFDTVKGYNPLELRYYQEMTGSIRNLSENLEHPVLDILGVKYIITNERLVRSGFTQVFGPYGKERIMIYENPGALPFCRLVSNITVMNGDEILKVLKNGDIDPTRVVLMERSPPGFTGGNIVTGNCSMEVERVANNEIKVSLDIPSNRILVLGQSYYGEWDVYIDGKESDLFRVYHGLTGVHVSSGEHEVRFIYDDLF